MLCFAVVKFNAAYAFDHWGGSLGNMSRRDVIAQLFGCYCSTLSMPIFQESSWNLQTHQHTLVKSNTTSKNSMGTSRSCYLTYDFGRLWQVHQERYLSQRPNESVPQKPSFFCTSLMKSKVTDSYTLVTSMEVCAQPLPQISSRIIDSHLVLCSRIVG